MNNKYKLLIGGGLILLVVIAGIFIFDQGSKTTEINNNKSLPATQEVDNKMIDSNDIVGNKSPIMQVSPTVTQSSPEDTARDFYIWYVENPNNLRSGAYQYREEISEEYKKIMSVYVQRGLNSQRDPVFNCGKALVKNIIPEQATLNNEQTIALVTIRDIDQQRGLFIIKLIKDNNGKWKVRDVWCKP